MSSICPQLECVKAEAQALSLCVCALIPTFLKELPPPHSLSEHDWHTDSRRRGLSVEHKLACVCDGHAHGLTHSKYTSFNHGCTMDLNRLMFGHSPECINLSYTAEWFTQAERVLGRTFFVVSRTTLISDSHSPKYNPETRHNDQPTIALTLKPEGKNRTGNREAFQLQFF